MLSINKRTHKIQFRDWSHINITTAQYEFYRDEVELKKHNEFITIEDIDTHDIIFEWRCSEIKEFQQINKDSSLSWAVYICDYGTRHPISMWGECECVKKYACMWFQFKDRLKILGYKINYAKDITKDMQRAYLESLT